MDASGHVPWYYQLLTIRSSAVAVSSRDTSEEPPQKTTTCPFVPSYNDLCEARIVLAALKLPAEIVLRILDHACYWPSLRFNNERVQQLDARGGQYMLMLPSNSALVCYDMEIPYPKVLKEEAKIREIEFKFETCDQTSESSTPGLVYDKSWVEVSILRPTGPHRPELPMQSPQLYHAWHRERSIWLSNLGQRGGKLVHRPESAEYRYQSGDEPIAWFLQRDRFERFPPPKYRGMTRETTTEHRVVWSTIEGRFFGNEDTGEGEGFLESIEAGDRILVWARTRSDRHFRACIIKNFQMTVYYGFWH